MFFVGSVCLVGNKNSMSVVSHLELRDILGRLHSLMALLEFDVGCGDNNNSSSKIHLGVKNAAAVKEILNDGRVQLLSTIMKISTLVDSGSGDGLSEDEKGWLRRYISDMLRHATQSKVELVLSNAIYMNSFTRTNHGRRIQIWYVYHNVLKEHGITPNPDYPTPPDG